MKEPSELERVCPKCGKTITYKSKKSCTVANRLASLCPGCGHQGILKPWKRVRPYEALYNRFVALAAHSVLISYEEFLVFTEVHSCFYCDDLVEWSQHNWKHGAGSHLDRIENDLPYQSGNIVVCCWPCNKSRGNRFTCAEFKIMMDARKAYRLQLGQVA